MKYQCSVDIDLPIERVVELYDDPDNYKAWQDGFVSYTPLSNNPGEPGAKSRLLYDHNGREMELIETIKVKNLPYEFTAVYEHQMMTNVMKNSFIPISSYKTRYEVEVEYVKFKHFIGKLMARFIPFVFKRQTEKWLNQFKSFAERESKTQDPNNSFITRY